jgi:hypothetical protein
MATDLTPHFEALRHAVGVASVNHDIWWVYKSREHRPKYVSTMNRYLGFFDTSVHAHFVAMVVALYHLYETRRDTFNVPRLLKIVQKESRLPTATLGRVMSLFNEAKPIWVKVGILRNKAFAHRSDSLTVAEIFKEAGITPDELKHLIERTKKLLNVVTRAVDGSVHAFNVTGTGATVRVLQDLKTYHAG